MLPPCSPTCSCPFRLGRQVRVSNINLHFLIWASGATTRADQIASSRVARGSRSAAPRFFEVHLSRSEPAQVSALLPSPNSEFANLPRRLGPSCRGLALPLPRQCALPRQVCPRFRGLAPESVKRQQTDEAGLTPTEPRTFRTRTMSQRATRRGTPERRCARY